VFFSSRRRHTRFSRDWSSDVCSSDLLKASDFDGVMFPGGFGVAKNLCTFAFKGSQGEVRADVNNVIHDFYNSKKPIGAVCIAPRSEERRVGKEDRSQEVPDD